MLAGFTLPAVCARAETAPGLGDLNGDGVLSAADAAMILRLSGTDALTADERPDCDFTQNGTIDATDARAALLFASGGIDDMVKFSERVASGLCDETLFDRFCYTGVQDDQNGNYKSRNVSVTILSGRIFDSDYYLADIYVQDITCIANVFSQGEFLGKAEAVEDMFDRCENGIVGVNGDFYSLHVYGPVVRNGVMYADSVTEKWDIAVLRVNGELATFGYGELTPETLTELDPYQTWVFGPSLLDAQGHAKTQFRSGVNPANPRTVLGYYEPGHYALMVVDGRRQASEGLTLEELSGLCEELGFAAAYNLDGGRSSVMVSKSGAIDEPYLGGRSCSDCIVVRELPLP
jgi:hypothetical protein